MSTNVPPFSPRVGGPAAAAAPTPGPWGGYGYGYELTSRGGRVKPGLLLFWVAVATAVGIGLYHSMSSLLQDIPSLLAAAPISSDPGALARSVIAQESAALRAQIAEQAARHSDIAARQHDAWDAVDALKQDFYVFAQELRGIEGRVLDMSRAVEERSGAVSEVMQMQAALREQQQQRRAEAAAWEEAVRNATEEATAAAAAAMEAADAVEARGEEAAKGAATAASTMTDKRAAAAVVAALEGEATKLQARAEELSKHAALHAEYVEALDATLDSLRATVDDAATQEQLKAFILELEARRKVSAETATPVDMDAVDALIRRAMAAHGVRADAGAVTSAFLPPVTEAAGQPVTELSASAAANCLGPGDLGRLVEEELAVFAADRTGRADHAALAAGGSIVREKGLTSPPWMSPGVTLGGTRHWLKLEAGLGGPEEAISRDAGLGSCFAMAGFGGGGGGGGGNGGESGGGGGGGKWGGGQLTVQMARPVAIDAVTLQHVSRLIALDSGGGGGGVAKSAPRDFEVYGRQGADDATPELLVTGRFDAAGPDVQTFAVPAEPGSGGSRVGTGSGRRRKFPMVTLKILSNHGQQEYTCLYRLRIHGTT